MGGLKAIDDVSNAAIKIAIYALILGSILGSTAFAAITIVNITYLSETYGTAIVVFIAFFGTILTFAALLWLVGYVRKVFDKKTGIGNLSA